MKQLFNITRYEFWHFVKSPFKVISLILFICAAIYSIQCGYGLYKKQNHEIEMVKKQDRETEAQVIGWYDAGKKGPAEKYWIDITTPMRAVWYAPASAFKAPSVLMPFSIGQAEQFGYYKQITNTSSVFDADLSEEIANPERLAIGTLDFSFVVIYLLPILIIVFLFNIGGFERDTGLYDMVKVNRLYVPLWLLARCLFYFVLTIVVVLLLMLSYALPLNALSERFFALFGIITLYIVCWFMVAFVVAVTGSGSSDQAIKLASIWLLLSIVFPGSIKQLTVSKNPSDYLTDYLDASREETYKLDELKSEQLKRKFLGSYPELSETAYGKENSTDEDVDHNSMSGLSNKIIKIASTKVENKNEDRNNFIRSMYWINPLAWFQNRMNTLCGTDYYSYRKYREKIQATIDLKIKLILIDSWNRKTVDKDQFIQYIDDLKEIQRSDH